MMPRRIFAYLVLFTILIASLGAQDRLYWDFPDPVDVANGGRFPQIVVAGDRMVLAWQEFQGEPGSLEATISIRAAFSEDGRQWSEPVTVAEDLAYLWLEEVPLFSVTAGGDGRLTAAVAVAREGVALYRQTSPGPAGSFEQTALIPSGPQAADAAVAPRLVTAPDGSHRLFLTRRTAVEGASRPTTLTIFQSTSEDGRTWSSPSLFIDPDSDRAADGAVLEQNFLPDYRAVDGTELVVFQSLRQGPEAQVYQLYVKSRPSGGTWSAARPLTEILGTRDGDEALLWDNQRPSLGLGADGEILVSWERRRGRDRPGIAAAVIDENGSVVSDTVEEVVDDRYTSAFPRALVLRESTWILWFDDTGIRLARRSAPYDYAVQAASLDGNTPGALRGSAAFPRSVRFRGNSYLLWQDSTVGLDRAVILRPDLFVAPPTLADANFLSGRPGNRRTLTVDWIPPEDSSGVLSHSWRWSRSPQALPSRAEGDQVYGAPRAAFTFESPEDAEGDWYFSLVARDQAGNWSEPLRLSYTLDITPPPPPVLEPLRTDAYGYLASNTFGIRWRDAESSAAAYYRWRMDYLAASPEDLDLEALEALSVRTGEGTETAERRVDWTNIDNGVWAFSVAAVDTAGNEGLPNSQVLLTNRYVPVTFITGITAARDEADRIILTLTGRGFAVGGLLIQGIIDRDGEAPWDYVYRRQDGRLEVLTDRTARIVGIDDMDEGTYRVGVVHPVRGVVFWNRTMRLDSTGNVKFGPFGLYAYESLWEPAALSLRLSGNQLLAALIALMAAAALFISVFRLISIGREARTLRQNAEAVLNRRPMSLEARREAARILRRKGMGLRNKFTLALSLLVIFTILMIAAVLGFVWIGMERDTLAEGLENESRLLVETLASSAITSIPTADRGNLLLLPDRIEALEDALWTTVTGPRGEISASGSLVATSEGSEYIWASNDPGILDKIALPRTLDEAALQQALSAADDGEREVLERAYPDGVETLDESERRIVAGVLRRVNLMPSSAGTGEFRIEDALSGNIEELRIDVEQAVRDAGIERMINELTVLEQQYTELALEAVATLDFENPAFVEAEAALAAQRKEIENLLLEISNSRFASQPEFNAEALGAGGPETFVFYKPLLYRTGDQDTQFFRGTVRLAVSVDDIRAALARVQRRILLITVLASVAALAVGVGVAFLIARQIVKPITSLARGVNVIREQPDMLQHEDFDVTLETGDELATLADTINGMVQGLVKAALDQKELIAGQEIQKTFLPLESGTSGKLSTGGASNAFFKLFGYYEGADAVSGDYFDFRQLDEDHYVMIKLDIAGHGVTASLIMVQVAALYVDYFRRVRDRARETGSLQYDLREFTFGINDLINEVGFQGRFAAFNLSVVNVRTAEYEMIHAGDNLVRVYDKTTRQMTILELAEAPAAGQIDSELIRMNPTMYQVVRGQLDRGQVLFLFTDGIEEAHHIIRGEDYQVAPWDRFDEAVKAADQRFLESGYKPLDTVDESNFAREEFDTVRIDAVIEAAFNRGAYDLERRCDLTIGKPLHFDFSNLEPTGENAVLALASVEKVFRIIPDDTGGNQSRVRVDRKIVEFLKVHFKEFEEFYHHQADEDEGYIYFSHMREDPQDDDLTIWAYERL